MTRVVNGIYDDIELDTGFFISDKETDLIASWLTCYADALEAAWKRANPPAAPKSARGAKHRQVRSFVDAVARKRGTSAAPSPVPSKPAPEKN